MNTLYLLCPDVVSYTLKFLDPLSFRNLSLASKQEKELYDKLWIENIQLFTGLSRDMEDFPYHIFIDSLLHKKCNIIVPCDRKTIILFRYMFLVCKSMTLGHYEQCIFEHDVEDHTFSKKILKEYFYDFDYESGKKNIFLDYFWDYQDVKDNLDPEEENSNDAVLDIYDDAILDVIDGIGNFISNVDFEIIDSRLFDTFSRESYMDPHKVISIMTLKDFECCDSLSKNVMFYHEKDQTYDKDYFNSFSNRCGRNLWSISYRKSENLSTKLTYKI